MGFWNGKRAVVTGGAGFLGSYVLGRARICVSPSRYLHARQGGSMGGEIEQPHDRFFKGLLAQPGVADALLRERLPAELVAKFGTGEPSASSDLRTEVAVRGRR